MHRHRGVCTQSRELRLSSSDSLVIVTQRLLQGQGIEKKILFVVITDGKVLTIVVNSTPYYTNVPNIVNPSTFGFQEKLYFLI